MKVWSLSEYSSWEGNNREIIDYLLREFERTTEIGNPLTPINRFLNPFERFLIEELSATRALSQFPERKIEFKPNTHK